jgi:hypothetical protein
MDGFGPNCQEQILDGLGPNHPELLLLLFFIFFPVSIYLFFLYILISLTNISFFL